ncbi:type VII secretion protein EccE [Rhodococcus opacus]|uniref:type VII secretion protein EccE n=1 Tax=Rhodococcus opacus TaxID=37919 RepID=UPI0024739E9F|nr:type VII secretion protein EccE [Rhodococcus opacus]MDH6290307.1 hypothetical protein [Rhodococcus opacus]
MQHDISLAGIDIVSHGYRAAAGSPATDVYDRLVGPLPATATRMVWLALRFDATEGVAAVARRGGGEEGVSRAITIAASRVAARAFSPHRRSNPQRCRSVGASIRRPSLRRGSMHRCPECATPATASVRAT